MTSLHQDARLYGHGCLEIEIFQKRVLFASRDAVCPYPYKTYSLLYALKIIHQPIPDNRQRLYVRLLVIAGAAERVQVAGGEPTAVIIVGGIPGVVFRPPVIEIAGNDLERRAIDREAHAVF